MNLNNKHARIYEGFVNEKVGNLQMDRMSAEQPAVLGSNARK